LKLSHTTSGLCLNHFPEANFSTDQNKRSGHWAWCHVFLQKWADVECVFHDQIECKYILARMQLLRKEVACCFGIALTSLS